MKKSEPLKPPEELRKVKPGSGKQVWVHNPDKEFPYESWGWSVPPMHMGPPTPVVIRFKTAEDRANFGNAEKAILSGTKL